MCTHHHYQILSQPTKARFGSCLDFPCHYIQQIVKSRVWNWRATEWPCNLNTTEPVYEYYIHRDATSRQPLCKPKKNFWSLLSVGFFLQKQQTLLQSFFCINCKMQMRQSDFTVMTELFIKFLFELLSEIALNTHNTSINSYMCIVVTSQFPKVAPCQLNASVILIFILISM